MPVFHTACIQYLDSVPQSGSQFQLPISTDTGKAVVIAQVVEFLPSIWEDWFEFSDPGLSAAQSPFLQAVGGRTNRWN